MSLYIPDIAPGTPVAWAAGQYAAAGWYVGPASIATKHPGSLLGKGWDEQTSRDPAQIQEWFTRWPEAGLFLHLGRSGATGIDVDHPEKLVSAHPDMAATVYGYTGPLQTTRGHLHPFTDPVTGGRAIRSHLVFLTPPGRSISNSNGETGKGWGDVRGQNGVFIVQPSAHTAVDGRYLWERTGPVPPMPAALAALLRDATPKVDAATLQQLQNARKGALGSMDTGLFERGPLQRWHAMIDAGDHRHYALNVVLPWVLREALAGMYPLEWAEQQIRELHVAACADPSLGSGGVRDDAEANAEFDALAAWSLGHASKADPHATVAGAIGRTTNAPLTSFLDDDEFGTPSTTTRPPAAPGTMLATWASQITMKAQRWLWEDKDIDARWIPLGGIVLLGGREGLGKSTLATKIAAAVTRGTLPGAHFGTPKTVVVCAGEDAWEQTIVPRFVAAGADLTRVIRVDVQAVDGVRGLELPQDQRALSDLCQRYDVALIVLDPLMTVVSGKLDTHKDAEVRKALGPLRDVAESAQVTVLGLIHVSKSKDEDLLTRMMASRAFTAVARAVLFCARQAPADPENDEFGTPREAEPETFLFGQLKSNLGPKVKSTIQYQIESVTVGHDIEIGIDITTSRIVDIGRVDERIDEIVGGQESSSRKRPAPKRDAAGEWLLSLISSNGPQTWAQVFSANGGRYSNDTLYKAKDDRKIVTTAKGEDVVWSLPPAFVTA